MMDPPDTIFLRAREISDSARRLAYVTEACGADAGLREEVESMLETARAADEFFAFVEAPATKPNLLQEHLGEVIGRYKLLEISGEGGMGVVYIAEQREPVVRQVALKIMKRGVDRRQIARFEGERQALALMDHPNIAKVLDGGETVQGRPYFVMDIVHGPTITEFCEDAKLSTRERLELFLTVCSAIQHAHQKGIIHRDIKPSNILVMPGDKPTPKIIDFGIAKATRPLPNKQTPVSELECLIGTPAYMSPEQAELSNFDLDTRSDIYSLGVLLYEMLTGTTPFDGTELLRSGVDEMRRTIREAEPVRASTRLTQRHLASGAKLSSKSEMKDLVAMLRSDLDWILLKCLEKDRARRYATVNDLASDIRRCLNKQPVLARAPSTTYQFKKFAYRNRLVFGAAAVVTLMLIVAVAVSSWQAVRAKHERARAERRLAATLKFVESVFSGVSEKLQNLVGGAAANEILNSNGLALMQELERDAGGSPEFNLALGKLYTQIAFGEGWVSGNSSGNYDLAFTTSTRAIHLLEGLESAVPKAEHARRLARAHMVAGYAAMGQRRYEESLAQFVEMGKWAKRLVRSSEPGLAAEGNKLRRWANGCTGEALEALGEPEKALCACYLPFLHELQSRNVSDESQTWTDLHDLVAVSSSLGRVYDLMGQPQNASGHLQQARRALEVMRKRFPNDAQVAAELPLAEAELGRFFLAQGSAEGLENLRSATNQIQRLVDDDRANISFAEQQIRIFRLCAVGMAAWSLKPSDGLLECQNRAICAEGLLEKAEALLAALPSEAVRRVLSADLEDARKKVAAAKDQAVQLQLR